MASRSEGLDAGRRASLVSVGGHRVAKTTKEESMYHKGCAVKVSTTMKDTMEAEQGAPEL